MTQVNTLFLVLLVEFTVVLVLGAAVMLFLFLRRRRRNWAVARELLALTKAGAKERRQETKTWLSRMVGPTNNAATGACDDIDQRELDLYRRIATVYLRRDAEMLLALDGAARELLRPCYALEPAAAPPARESEQGAEGADNGGSEEMERLAAENARLTQELHITRDTMSKMLNEYATMFGRGNDAKKAEIMATVKTNEDEPADVA